MSPPRQEDESAEHERRRGAGQDQRQTSRLGTAIEAAWPPRTPGLPFGRGRAQRLPEQMVGRDDSGPSARYAWMRRSRSN